ncbi:MAG: efflux RND transporter periplasmic adaptor subunit [Proteobacteria bacterium]|nr:MAG: efflux RND transporter periplasmic adaptor subunit [Pseudomonadota bacterium]
MRMEICFMSVSKICLALLTSLTLLSAACEKKSDKVGLPEEKVLPKGAAEAPSAPAQPAAQTAAAPEGAVPSDGAVAVQPTPAEGGAAPAAAASEGVQVSFPGAVSSQRRSTLSFRVAGFIETINLKAGDSCKKGAVLAALDSRDYRLAVDMAKSQLDLAKAAADNASAEFKREKELQAQNASSGTNFDRLKAQFENASANQKLAELRLVQAQQALGDTRLVAPYDCVISKQLTNVGQNVKSGDAAYEVYDVTDIEVSFNVPERMAGKLKLGEKIQVRIPATGFEGALDILRIVTVVDDKTRTFQVVAKAPQKDPRIVPGLYAEGIVR